MAERIGVSRQAVAKWETGQSAPDILNCGALAKLHDVELDDLIHKELSNGMKVKYLLALALSRHAELLVLDEPISGLATVSREELLYVFRQIAKSEKCSILFSTHITSDLDRCADDMM